MIRERFVCPPLQELPSLMPQIVELPHIEKILIAPEAGVIYVERKGEPTEEDREFMFDPATVAREADTIEADTMIETVPPLQRIHYLCETLRRRGGLVPARFLVGDTQRFLHWLGLPGGDFLFGIPVQEVGDFPPSTGVLAGALSHVDPILGVKLSIRFTVGEPK